VQEVARLLAAGADPNVKDLDGDAPLHIAAEQCRADIAELLFRYGADPNARDAEGRTPLHRAADESCADVAELLLDHGADPNVVDRGGRTPLHLVDIHVDLLEILLSRGAYPDVARPGGEAAIIKYAMDGYVDEVAVLLDHGAHPEVKDDFLRTPAFYAAEGGHVDVLYLLLDRGAKVTLREAALIGDVYLAEELLKQGADPNEQDISGRTPLHYAFWAPEGGWRCHVEVAELLLRHGAEADLEAFDEVPWFDTTDEEYYHGQRVLGQRGIMKLFAERGVLSMCYKDCETPLHRIYKHDYYKQPWLLEFGGDPNVRDRHGRTPLHHAAAEGRGLEPLLEAGADPNARDKEGKTPLHYAVAHGHSDAVKLLLEYGAEVGGELAEALRLTPLHLAALRGSAEEVERLLNGGADPNVRDVFYRTPLHYAAARNHKAVAELLLKHGADPNAKDENGKTPLDLAVRRCAVDVLELLLPLGDVNAVAEKAWCLAVLKKLGFETPENVRRRCEPYVAQALKADVSSVEYVLREAAYAGCGEVASILRRRFPAEVVRGAAFELVGLSPPEELQLQDLRERCIWGSIAWLLLSRGVDPNTRDVHGLTLLHAAAWCGDESAAELLLKAGADPNARDAEGNTPLHVAARRMFPQVALLLLKHGADPNAANARGETPLHIAARGDKYTIGSGNYAVVSILVKHGADPNARDRDGNTPLHYAAARCAFATASLLLKHGVDPNARNNEGETPLDLLNCPKMARAFRRLFSGARR